jgi:glycosyltransferase involved in cell wall biosynthesis
MTPTVSVIIPSYNHGRFIGRALQCLLAQTTVDWEAIVVDNHSTDDTDDVLRRYADPRIRCEKIHNDGIIARSRNHGLRAATGEWVALLDSDDWWTADKLERCVAAGAHADLVYHGMRIVRDDGARPSRATIRSRALRTPVWLDLIIDGNPIPNSSVLVRRELMHRIGYLREDRAMVAAEDFNAWLRVARITDRFVFLPAILGSYLEHGTGMSQKDMSDVHACATAEFSADMTARQRRRRDARAAYIRGRHYFGLGDGGRAQAALWIPLRDGTLELRAKSAYMLLRLMLGARRLS